jgi:hypothetical protein
MVPAQHKSFLLSLRQKRSLSDLANFLHPPSDVASGLIYKILREHPELLLDPEVMDVIAHVTGVKGSITDLDPVEVADVMKVWSLVAVCLTELQCWFGILQKLLLTADGLQHLSCDDKELDKLLIPPSPNDTDAIVSYPELCISVI